MIQVFCARRGSGKTKRLIDLANSHVNNSKGDSVYIDDDSRPMRLLKRSIRFVTTKDFKVEDCKSFYGLLCGLISQNYDIENIYIDGLSNIVNCPISESTQLFGQLKELANKFSINLYINVNCDNTEDLPDFIREYVA
ncbi:hypothetical protein [Clostridium chauvoei]|uniref:Uncharacterized protein n=3 Tax=Clostridium chauvoei TaxID=46867 RepID=S6EXQ0_9CLOT|nr:hypothetical protein [Clostridium chauvoei]ATD54404.1 hypothetical protein BTM20_03800 [Clostridium chauvoei]ATD57913.1 hypothetical protein BTM21_09260 [Clostridium chauvoei]MBX7279704.1 hypothetical protein [Clostridium chauvoei]MBX7282073.1 hypothetical protein [Clostridium chauvoei]MBX7284595.1 hypothetical protein [Clostridium chauvoei]